ncbi:NAC domain-containing protein 2-like [Panicum miliaceum]|uniref:NAC domain-containing protein 2-like n=1 Tax=Panicum miliaceum TaxID=4540 RepID=A0A3L6SGM0_PANMI|nr:NAC domain-containing protein 2-like [Panicum miliaceum]
MADEEPNLIAEEDGADHLPAGDLGGFDPTEDELVLHFLRPQLRGFPPRVAGAVLEADPCGAAPWELLARYGLREHGHFFAARGRGRPFVRRAVAGAGAWMHSSTRAGRSVTDLGVVVRWSRVKFCFYARGAGQGQQRSTGWVMDEYEITDPRCYRRCDEEGKEEDYWVLCRVRKSKRPAAAAAASPPAR